MEGVLRESGVRIGGDARQRFYDARGYGRPLGDSEIELTRVEAAHLLFRGDLDTVRADGDRLDFESFFVAAARERDRFALRFLVYADLRDRGFYLSPAREEWPGAAVEPDADFAVYERGAGPPSGAIAYRLSVVGERESIEAAALANEETDADRVLAVVDEESEITYLAVSRPGFDGATDYDPPSGLAGVLLYDRVVCWDAPPDLYERGFYGQPLAGRAAVVENALQLSLVESAALAAADRLSIAVPDESASGSDYDAVLARGRAVEGDRFDRRLAVYRTLRDRDVVPKTGYKFGADFRTYDAVTTVSALPHSERLIRVVPPDYVFDPRELALDVRLAGGVKKRMVFALTDGTHIQWLAVSRLTP